jgi:hypothetical protein
MPRLLLIAVLVLLIPLTIAVSARAQSDTEEREQLQEQQAGGGKNPLTSQRTQVAFSGSGTATFTPHNENGSMAGPTPAPNCTPTVTQVGFNIQCLSDPDTKSSSTCRGTLSLFGFNETRNVSGEVAALGDSYTMKLNSADDDIQGCDLSNVAPVSTSLGNVISMHGCGINIAGCVGDLVGAGGDHALTSSASVILTPSD